MYLWVDVDKLMHRLAFLLMQTAQMSIVNSTQKYNLSIDWIAIIGLTGVSPPKQRINGMCKGSTIELAGARGLKFCRSILDGRDLWISCPLFFG